MMVEEKREIVQACMALSAVAAGITRVLETVAKAEPQRGPAKGGAVIQMPRRMAAAVGQ